MGSCGYFCEWTNEIKAQKFVPQQSVSYYHIVLCVCVCVFFFLIKDLLLALPDSNVFLLSSF